VVWEMLKPKRSGYSLKRRPRRVDFPAPLGPDTTIGRAERPEKVVVSRKVGCGRRKWRFYLLAPWLRTCVYGLKTQM